MYLYSSALGCFENLLSYLQHAFKIFLKQNKDSSAGKEVERVKEQMICMQGKQSEEKVNEHNSWRILLDSLWKYIIAHL